MAITIALALVAVLGLATGALGAAQPTVTAVWPRMGPVAGGTPLTVVGSGFSVATPSVTIAGIPASNVNVVSDSVLKVPAPSLPNGATPTGAVVVSTSAGTSSSAGPLASYTYRGGTSLGVPSYFYPLTTGWTKIDGPPRSVDLAVINPNSGPGTSFDPNYATQVAASQAAGVDVVGYVHTSYGRRSLSTVEAEITHYEQWYGVNGIFVDEAAASCSSEASYYAPLYTFIHAQPGLDLTVLNPGGSTNSCYMAASDVVMTFEGTPTDLAGATTVPGYDPSRFWAVVYGARATALPSALATLASDGFGTVYVTDQNLPNPWAALPTYWSQEVADAAGASPPAAPVVSGVVPNTGPAAGGTAVTITGSNLTGGSVAFGASAATGVSCTAGSCTATSPAGSGTVHVTVTTVSGPSATGTADQFTYQSPPVTSNLLPDPGFETSGVPTDYWGSTLARSGAVVHSGSWALAQTITSTSGGWGLDLNPGWYAPISSTHSYTASIWVRATATVRVNVSLDLLNAGGSYIDSATGPWVTLVANTWTQLTVTGVKPVSGETEGVMEPDFSNSTNGTVIYWDDMSVTAP